MSLSDDIKNVQINGLLRLTAITKVIDDNDGIIEAIKTAYKLGHRDALHAAAELALRAEGK